MSNFNINVKVEKAMKVISESKALRRWSYIVLVLIIVGIIFFKSGEIFTGIADLVRAVNGR